MTNSPHSPPSSHQIPLDFRAPPPSPVASGRRSSVANDEILSEFLNRSLRVPDLVLPDRVFPRQNSKIQNLPKLDFKLLNPNIPELLDNHCVSKTIDVIAQTGCFELVNHGISDQILASVVESSGGVFGLSMEKKAVVSRSNERLYGFVEFHGDEKESNEEFVWCRDDSLRSEMEEIWPDQYSDFSEKMENLMSEIENISETLLKLFINGSNPKPRYDDDGTREGEMDRSVCYIYKHCPDTDTVPNDDQCMDSLRYDVIRMLIRGSEHPHTLCFHVCDGSSEFHVYSKKGWVSFSPDNNALIVTIGDQLQTWSEGKYKHVIGRPIFKGKLEDYRISMAFLYNPPPPPSTSKGQKDKTISFSHQVLLVLILIFLYNLFSYVFT